MGGATGQSLCACYKERQEFQKVLELKGTGLVVYCRTTSKEEVQPGELIRTSKSASHDAFILHNTKDEKITTSDLKSTLEQNDISCPRCRQRFEDAQELLRNVKLIDRKDVIGVCDHCLKKAQSIKKPCYECEIITKKFISTRDKQKENTKRCVKLWLSKMSDYLKDVVTLDMKLKTRAYSDLQIDRLHQYSPKSRREPEVKQMFYPETRKSDTNLNTETENIHLAEMFEKSVGFTQAVESVDTPYATYGGGKMDTKTVGPWRDQSDETFVEPHRVAKGPQKTSLRDPQDLKKQEQLSEYYDDLPMDVKESVKKKHDLSLRHIMRTEKKTRIPFRPEIYEIPKIAPWETISKHSDDSGIDSTIATKTKHDLSSREIESPVDVEPPQKYKSSTKTDLMSDRELKSQKYVTKVSQKDLPESPQKKEHIRSSDNIVESVLDIKRATKRKLDLNLKHVMGFERGTQDPSKEHRGKPNASGKLSKGIYSSEEIPKKIIKQDLPYITDGVLKYQRSVPIISHEAERPEHRVEKTKIKGKKPIDSEKIPEYVIRKQFSYFFPKTMKKEENILDARSSQLIKNTQERLRQRAEEEKKRHEVERKYKLEEEEKNKHAREERKRVAEEKKKQHIYVEDQEIIKYIKKDSERMISEEEKRHYIFKDGKNKIDSMLAYETKDSDELKKDLKIKSELNGKGDRGLGKNTKDMKIKTELIDKIEEVSEKTKKISKSELGDKIDEISEKRKRELKSKSEQRDTIDSVLEKPKKELKPKQEQRDKSDYILEKARKELKPKLEQRNKIDEVLEKQKKELKSKTEQRGKIDDASEKIKKDKAKSEQEDKIQVSDKTKRGKSNSEPQDTTEELSEKTRKDLKSKSGHKDQIDTILEKSKREFNSKPDYGDKIHKTAVITKGELKSKSRQKNEIHDVSEKTKKGNSKLEPQIKRDDVTDKSRKAVTRDKIEEISEKPKKLLKHERKEESDELNERSKKDLKSKSEPRDKVDDISENKKKELKSKSDEKSTAKEGTDKAKDLQSKPVPTDKIDKEKRDKEDKDRMNQVAQLRKERQSDSHKKQDSAKEIEDPTKKIETSKEKKSPSKKTEDIAKENVVKKGELGKKPIEPSVDTEAPLKTKQWTSKELEQFAKKQKDKENEEISERKLAKDVAETITKKLNSIKEKEEPSKGKEISIPKKEESGKVKEESIEVEGKVADVPKKPKDGMDEAQFRKLQAELAKQKEEDLKKKRLLEIEAQKFRDLADKKAKEEADRKSKVTREAKAVMKPEPERPAAYSAKEAEEPIMKEFRIQNIKIRNTSSDDLILRLVRIKQTATRQTIKPRPCDIDPEVVKAHKCHHKSGQTSSLCELCNDSELEIDVESYENKINLKKEVTEIIIGEKIHKQKPSHFEKPEEPEVIPILFQSIFQEEPLPPREIVQIVPSEAEILKKTVLPNLLQSKDSKGMEPEPGRGIIRYALSDRTFIDKGWTMLPTEKVVRKMNVYRMRPAHPEFDWFEHNKNKRVMNYDTGEKLAEFDDNGRGRWYYRSGRLALDYYDAEETNAQQRFVIYSSGEPDERGRTHPITILATFDYLGNGIVFDHAGKIRLKYNQTEGVVLDRGIGPVSHWKWHTLNDPPVLQQVMIDTQMAHKDPAIIKLGTPADTKTRPDNEEMLAIEFDNFIKEKSKKLSQKFKPFQIKMKALKINEHFSLKVLDQATIYLIFRDGSTNLKLNIGMILDHQEIVDTDTAEVGEVSNSLERYPARTDSLAGLQRSVAYAQRYERQRTERERRLRPPEPCASADQLNAAASPPLRLPLRTVPAGSTSSAGYCNCRKPANNLYYNTRLL